MATELKVTASIAIPESELEEHFVLSSGAGGQNVNKVASAVQLRFDALHSPSLPDDVRVRLLKLAGPPVDEGRRPDRHRARIPRPGP